MQELYAHISQAGHPRRPRIIRDDVWELMLRLWVKEPEARPTMTEVALVLKQIYERFDGRRTENTSY
uniref:Uncharacterized protein n=1 Tax=Romanomermis culicivorax TaxID=13658 RepID=A0A915JNE4_ROMCU